MTKRQYAPQDQNKIYPELRPVLGRIDPMISPCTPTEQILLAPVPFTRLRINSFRASAGHHIFPDRQRSVLISSSSNSPKRVFPLAGTIQRKAERSING